MRDVLYRYLSVLLLSVCHKIIRGRRGRDRMIVGFTAICVINTYRHLRCEFESRSDGAAVSSTNNTDRHDKTEILLKVALNAITPCLSQSNVYTLYK